MKHYSELKMVLSQSGVQTYFWLEKLRAFCFFLQKE